ncbi:MAG: MFS transporter [Bacillota bacterium]
MSAVAETYLNIFRRYPLLLGIGSVALVATLGFAVFIPILPLYLAEDLGISPGIIGLIFGAYAASETIFKTPMGVLSDRVGRRPVIMTGLVVSFLVPLVMIFVDHYLYFVGLQFLNGFAIAAFWPALSALTADEVPLTERATAMTVFNMSYLLALGLGPGLGTFINQAFASRQAAFYAAAALNGAAAVLAFFTLQQSAGNKAGVMSDPSRNGPRTGRARALGSPGVLGASSFLWKNRVLGAMLAISLIQMFGAGMLAPIFVLFASRQLGFTEAEIGKSLLGPALVVAVFALPLGRLADALGKHRAAQAAFAVAAAAVLLMPEIGTVWVLICLVAMLGLAYVVGAPAWTALTTMVAPGDGKGTAIAAVSTMQSLGFILGSSAGGFLYAHVSPASPFQACAAMLFICFFLTLALVTPAVAPRRKEKRDERAA